MEIQRTKTITLEPLIESSNFTYSADVINENLDILLSANAEIDKEKIIFRNENEKLDVELMRHPIQVDKAFAYFGFLLGTFPPAAFFLKYFLQSNRVEPGIVFLLIFVNIVCAVVGYFSGKIVGNIVHKLENLSWNLMLVLLPFVGLVWGIITGGAGGIFIFVIGAVFGAIIAAIVGMVAIPAFTIFHRFLKKGDLIERNHFLPIAFGITFVISAYILGL